MERANKKRPRSIGQFFVIFCAEELRPSGRIPARIKAIADRVRPSKARVRSVPLWRIEEAWRLCRNRKDRRRSVPRKLAEYRAFRNVAMLSADRMRDAPSIYANAGAAGVHGGTTGMPPSKRP
jgi:hypothetical protein